ncbi:MAG: DUF4153 domain-containing protein [Hyphomicrobiales bacterium]
MLSRLSRLIPDLSQTAARFPVPVLISLLLVVYANLDIARYVEEGWNADNPVYLAGASAFMAAGALHYFALGRGIGAGLSFLLALIAAALVGTSSYFAGGLHVSWIFMFAGLLPALMIAGFLRPGAKQGALWLFNLRLGLAALLAVLVGVVFAAGLSAIVESLNFLFEAGLPNELHGHIWATAAALIAPIYGLSLAPRDLSEEVHIADQRDTLLERGISVLVNYVLVPMALVYALILHAYAVKIVLDGNLPKNQIGLMVTIFALGGTGAWLIAWPWRETGSRLLRWFVQGWFWLTIVPAILLVIAVWERISAYGVTPERYGLVIVAIWLAMVTLYLAIRRNRADMRMLLGSFAVLVLIGAGGPWGANGLTISDQFARLTKLLTENKMVGEDQRLAETLPDIPNDTKSQIRSLLDTLNKVDGLDRLRPLFAGKSNDPFAKGETGWNLTNALADALNLNEYQTAPTYVSFSANRPISTAITGAGHLLGPIRAYTAGSVTTGDEASATYDKTDLTIVWGARNWKIAIPTLMQKAESGGITDGSPLRITVAPDADMVLTELYGDKGDIPILRGATFWLVVRE